MDEKIPGENMNRIRRYALPTDFKENKVLEQVDLKFSRNSNGFGQVSIQNSRSGDKVSQFENLR